MSVTSPTLSSLPKPVQTAGLLVVALLIALCANLGNLATAQAAPRPASQVAAAAAGTVHGCSYKYLCLYTGYNYSGTIHRLYNCQTYYTPYAFHSVVNNQTGGTRANFYDRSVHLIWTSRAALWYSGNTDGIAGGLGSRSWYVKPC